MSTNRDQARALVRQAAEVIRRDKTSDRAQKFLRLAESNISHPDPMMFHDLQPNTVGRLAHPDGHEVDYGNVFFTLEEFIEVTGLSRTTLRKLVNDGWMKQRHRGLYCLHDFLPAADDYFHSGDRR
ncbi:type IV toxin-antitoxin system AbiEi family antitoxin domain-containing protein [Bradyrhizobium sp. HKCCYLS3077]|uniref:type IV toxin-antitoxin system AbiEi family antitoxin domain-containing protein n=1 Tax=Bradyrhizobium sp. HKCCYLS3077 TaxID=3420761 RepID=UPI003EBA4463